MKCNYERYRNLVINLYQEGIPATVCIYVCLHVLEIGQYMNVLCTYCSSNIHILLTLIYRDISDSIQSILCSHMCDGICEKGSVLFISCIQYLDFKDI